jgi:hypothetical protein
MLDLPRSTPKAEWRKAWSAHRRLQSAPRIQWFRPFPAPTPMGHPVLLDGQAAKLQSLAEGFERDDAETAAFLHAVAERLDRQVEQIQTLQAATGGYDAGIKAAYDRIYSRRNIEAEEAAPKFTKSYLQMRELERAIAAAPVRKVATGVSGLPENQPAPKKMKVGAVILDDLDLKALGI